MGYAAVFKGWGKLTIEDLLVAYRKAKADCFFENTFPAAIKFAEYEQDLLGNLNLLLERLSSKSGFFDDDGMLGEYRILPKKLSIDPKRNGSKGHIHFSCPVRAFEHIKSNSDVVPEFRIVGDFPVDAHVVSALWINMVGHKFDACLGQDCYGARLKRVRDDESLDKNSHKPFHVRAVGSFTPYFQPYQKWRNDGLRAIRYELEKDRDVIAVSLDLKSYYHFVDPLAIAAPELQKKLGVELSRDEQQFTKVLAQFLSNWSKGAQDFSEKLVKEAVEIPGGLVIGLTATRIISNVLLSHWDRLIREEIAPIHYGRYVDDMFIVLHDTGNITSAKEFMFFLQSRLGEDCIFQESDDEGRQRNKDEKLWEIQQGEELQKKTKIKLQAEKQKLFVLHGRAGLDLLDSIEKEIYELSSEHRLMPSPDQLEDSTAARVLSAAGSVGDQADTLRRADGLTIRRLSWSLQLRHVETLARDLPPNEWVKQREEFYQFAHNHIVRPENIFAHFVYLPRLLGFAISLNEWEHAEQIVVRSFSAIDQLAAHVKSGKLIGLNGTEAKAGNELWRYVKGTLAWMFVDAAARYYDPKKLLNKNRPKKEARLAELFLQVIIEALTDFGDILDFRIGSEDFYKKAPLIAMADLAKEPYRRILNIRSVQDLVVENSGNDEKFISSLMANSELIDVDALKLFLKSTRRSRLHKVTAAARKQESLMPYLFPTRPLTPAEIAELAPECVGLPGNSREVFTESPAAIWAKYVQALRGVWIQPTLLALEQEGKSEATDAGNYLHIGTKRKSKVVVALTNIKTDDSSWAATACDKPNLSLERYSRIAELVNQAIQLNPKPDYVLFPELSVPLRWVDSIAGRLSAVGISLVAGTEYRHYPKNKVISEAYLVLADNRLGFPASVIIRQPKLQPAVGEDQQLTAIYGKYWAYGKLKKSSSKPVYIHNGVCFGVMVCSELQNSKARVDFQGNIDALMVLSWNKDLETFSALIESAALDVHAYTILANNRKYGDSRVRAPSKEPYMRELARVRGGDNDFIIAATLDIDALRAFQSRAKRWPQSDDLFKPLPEGFKLSHRRRRLPPK
ncbi:TPA: RNA-directed DNA polymerase [Pseudomonas aeruginosa]|uniref:RNA-directed DNA polymerase n=1 Tax=Pseudomonas aeruginosa TaxID=287 RepID=UPI000940A75B|nr:RNA-directed DNA polymerase [Pseudomonas aeruginosa]EKU7447585.1 RNA-directed DNA polymerase [Pseudomonas aeruginosa]MBI8584950.1 RNA-directed DNA polymerase [Pseudomonas aeruginosa]MCS8064068.1 RNA-directed DNA polymerase [Pseudomonas aeruginosa]MCU9476798.1 RNA-directed DNA polymerase [Pseudomonas aeruginosa]QYA80132.1 RNA-directed DNA polymerase [Pseudomonas aeruginosa]